MFCFCTLSPTRRARRMQARMQHTMQQQQQRRRSSGASGWLPNPLPSPTSAHLLFSTVSLSFRFWKYCRIALACCRWYSTVTPLQGKMNTGSVCASVGERCVRGQGQEQHSGTIGGHACPTGLHCLPCQQRRH